MEPKKVIYYTSENEEPIPFKQSNITITEKYKYIHKNPFYRFWSWFTYRFIATPFAFITYKLFKKVKFHNRKILKKFKKTGYFIYANHTHSTCDCFCPTLLTFPKKPHIIVNSANLSLPVIGKLINMWGALPLPDNLQATKNFYQAIEHNLNKNNPILIYPEAHLWPYYTKIRNFSSASFRYPAKYNKPVFTFTTTYKQKKLGKKPKIEIYVDGPFYVDNNLSTKDAQQKLRDEVYLKMNERASLSNCEYFKYIQRREND